MFVEIVLKRPLHKKTDLSITVVDLIMDVCLLVPKIAVLLFFWLVNEFLPAVLNGC